MKIMSDIQDVILEVKKAVIGKDDVITKVLMTILARGHILLEDIPGVGKTNLALAFSKSLDLQYNRIQLTPDVMPSDIVGFTMYSTKTEEFEFRKGVAFCHLLLADEINRTSSKTQSALLELMEEAQVTVDGETYKLPQPYCIIATQNPFGSAGTQMLPDSQLDRFMTRLSIGYPSFLDEIEILKTRHHSSPLAKIHSVLTPEVLSNMQKAVDNVYMSDEIYTYIVSIIDATRHHNDILQGASPRGSIAMMKMSKACAYMKGRDYVIPQDVQTISKDVLSHRLLLSYEAKMKNISTGDLIEDILSNIQAPGDEYGV